MSYSVEKLPDAPVMLLTFYSDFSMRHEGEAAVADMLKVLDAQDKPIFYVSNMLHATLNFEDVMLGATLATRGAALLKHPNIREVISVTDSKAYKLVFKGFNTVTFGYIPVRIFETLEEALNYCRMA